jgi:PPOX class probable F420-dependent enzyme
MPRIATADSVSRDELVAFLRPRHRALLVTARADGRPQVSPVTCGVDEEGRVVVSTYPQRAKSRNARRDERVTVCVLSDDWDGPYVLTSRSNSDAANASALPH